MREEAHGTREDGRGADRGARTPGQRMNLSQVLQAASLTDSGRVRDHNEDCIESRPESGLYVLADGMGGYNAGEVASGMATSLITDGLNEAWNPRAVERLGRDEAKALAERLIREQIARANSAVFYHLPEQPRVRGHGHHARDVPLLRQLRGRGPHRRLAPLSPARRGDGAGDARPFAAPGAARLRPHHARGSQALSQNKNLVTRALAIHPPAAPEIHVHEAAPDDLYLLCSDGLSDMVEDEEIRLTLITLRSNPTLTVQQLVQAANDNGGRDNISAMLIRVAEPFGVPRGWLARVKALFR